LRGVNGQRELVDLARPASNSSLQINYCVQVKTSLTCKPETSPVCLAHLVGLVYLVDLVHLVYPVSLVQPNKQDKPNKPIKRDRPDRLAGFFSILLVC